MGNCSHWLFTLRFKVGTISFCTFIMCSFDGLLLVYINISVIYRNMLYMKMNLTIFLFPFSNESMMFLWKNAQNSLCVIMPFEMLSSPNYKREICVFCFHNGSLTLTDTVWGNCSTRLQSCLYTNNTRRLNRKQCTIKTNRNKLQND